MGEKCAQSDARLLSLQNCQECHVILLSKITAPLILREALMMMMMRLERLLTVVMIYLL